MSILIARKLGPEGQGFYSLCANAAVVASLFVNCGLGLSNVYFLGKKLRSPGDMASLSLGFGLTGGVLAFCLAALAVLVLRVPGLAGVPSWALILAFAAIPFLNVQEYYSYFLIGSDRILQFNLLSVGRNVAQFLLAALLILGAGLGLAGAVGSWALSFTLAAGAGLVLARRLAPVGFSLRGSLMKPAIWFGIKGYLSRIASFLYYRVGIFILSYYAGAAAVGHYAVAILLAELLWNIPSSLAPAVMLKSASEESDSRDKVTAAACRHTVLMCGTAGLAMGLFAGPLILLVFGRVYLPAVKPLVILLPGTALLSIGSVLANDFVGRGKQLMNSFAAFVTLVVNVVLSLAFVPLWGTAGAAAAAAVSYATGTAVMVVEFLRITGMKPAQVLVPRGGDARAYVELAARLLARRRV
ncbi:MAG: polysaccharide biosynthesis C-terminal domain-containing protein [Candidatus Eisenbacteria bacterium]|nr:polysaccharide biosynthesis C-terminal domain-containing protein [Candidatus Eisenbacteria bacterium]